MNRLFRIMNRSNIFYFLSCPGLLFLQIMGEKIQRNSYYFILYRVKVKTNKKSLSKNQSIKKNWAISLPIIRRREESKISLFWADQEYLKWNTENLKEIESQINGILHVWSSCLNPKKKSKLKSKQISMKASEN